ncbi:hypothetical protein [Archaeoglobus sulfaticallidus]|uniref:hypothetical protein n=1 Tax=Archaeoglobus sulfaticallidus TaxID=1316941 RepID=UPI0011818D52|nr:hypothetical protein [Archaeoglobus sulfaticallidus]
MLLVGIVLVQALLQRKQTKIMSEPIIDANALFIGEEIKLWVVNVGNFVAKDPKLIVEVNSPTTTYKYICHLFPSLPPLSIYKPLGANEIELKIKPLFWANESEGKWYSIFELMDYLSSAGFGNEKIQTRVQLEYSKDKERDKIEILSPIETEPANFKEYIGIDILGPKVNQPKKLSQSLFDFFSSFMNRIRIKSKLKQKNRKKELIFEYYRQVGVERIR